MGAGSGYWARLLQHRGVDVVAYDLHIDGDEEEESKENEKDDGKTAATSGEESHGEAEETMESGDGEQAEEEEQSEDEEERGGDEEDEDEEEVEVEQVYWTKVVSGTPKVHAIECRSSDGRPFRLPLLTAAVDRIYGSMQTVRCSCATPMTLRTAVSPWRWRVSVITQVIH